MYGYTLPADFDSGDCFTCVKKLTMTENANFLAGHMYLLAGIQPNPRQPGEYRFHMIHIGTGAKIVFEYDFSTGNDNWLKNFSKVKFPLFFS